MLPRSGIQDVTPEIAKRWLATQVHNRNQSQHHIDQLASDLTEGRWVLTTDAIGFDTEGHLINGQHRLKAIIQAQTPAVLAVMANLPASTIHALDTNRPRSAADILTLNGGARNATTVASIVGRVLVWERTDGFRTGDPRTLKSKAFSKAAILDRFAEDRERFEGSASFASYARLPAIGPTVVGMVDYLVNRQEEYREFVQAVRHGANLRDGSPELALSRVINNYAMRRVQLSPREQAGLLIKAWNTFVSKGQIRVLRFNPEEVMARIS